MGNYHSFERIKAIALCQIFVYPSTQILSLKFTSSIFKGNEIPESAPGHQAFKIKTE